jgi:basic membrane protein A
MKKIFALLLAAALIFTLVACATPEADPEPEPAPAEEVTPDPEPDPDEEVDVEEPDEEVVAAEGDIRIALVAHSPDSILDDGSFNQGAWDGILRFLDDHGLSRDNADFFQPHVGDDEARIDLVAHAISEFGANVVVLPGFHFVVSSYEMQNAFPDVHFVLLDASPGDGQGNPLPIAANLAAIHYAEEQAGFLAGYAAIMEGYRNLGFMGGIAVPAVVRFGHGFLQGADYAADSLGLSPGDVTVNYYYIGGFAPDPGVATMASAWFADGIEVIFAAAGGAGGSVMSGAEASGGVVIGVDVDQAADSDTVITSAMKALAVSVYDMLQDVMNDSFRGGGELMFDASVNGIGLPMDTSRFETFTTEQYEAIFALLADGTITVNNDVTSTPSEANLDLTIVEVNELN